ncbi:ROK family transcriptional regulator [Janibacter sp. HTCC2649]|uniref:ROK family transcriptional regulator n=1 Tax=Janibacter sp. HTCC2649 TaxID=313589 RepID=UPI00192CD5D5|nr:ROK family transcriptional regulator [Janibacter sp. HTCC2649]
MRRTPRSGRLDQAQMRAANMGLILRQLQLHGGRSRAGLATETGLSKATTSSLIADLAERGLVREGEIHRAGSVGRPGLTVNLDGRRVAGLGLEISIDYVAVTAVDLTGNVIRESITPMDVPELAVEVVLDRVAGIAQRMLESLRSAGHIVVGFTVAPPGVIDYDAGIVRFAPNLGWRSVALAAGLSERIGPECPEIHLENDAKLAAVAEYGAYADSEVQDLVYLSGEVGVGAGIIAEGRLVRGWSGFSGEVGHLALGPSELECSCGRRGCWELVVGLHHFLRLAAPVGDVVHDSRRSMDDRLEILRERAASGDERTLEALAAIARDLIRGLSVLVDVLNPRRIVLGGYFAPFGEQLLAPVKSALDERRMDAGSEVVVAVSALGLSAASRGGALAALEAVFEDPTTVPAA